MSSPESEMMDPVTRWITTEFDASTWQSTVDSLRKLADWIYYGGRELQEMRDDGHLYNLRQANADYFLDVIADRISSHNDNDKDADR